MCFLSFFNIAQSSLFVSSSASPFYPAGTGEPVTAEKVKRMFRSVCYCSYNCLYALGGY